MAIIYRYGPPRSVAMLLAALAVQARDRRWQSYMADMSYNLLLALSGGKLDIPTYGEMMKPRDNRTAQQIKDDVIARLSK